MSRDQRSSLPIDFNFSTTRLAIVQSTYHSDITNKLLEGAVATIKSHGVQYIHHIEMPGAYELVYGCMKSIEIIEKLDGVIALGCVVRGDTDHDQYINHAVAAGLIQIEQKYKIPIGFGLLTTNTMLQAEERAGGIHGNKGAETALAVLHALSFKVNQI